MHGALFAGVLHVASLYSACVVNHLQPKRPHVRPARLRWPASWLMSVLREVCNPAARVSASRAEMLRSIQACIGLVPHVTAYRPIADYLMDCSAIRRNARSCLRKADAREYDSGA